MAADGLAAVTARAAAAAARVGRSRADVTIVAVSKTVGPGEVMEAYRAGHRHFGENRADELANKAGRLPDDITWHFIGTLQSRKAREVAPIASVVHSIDRESVIRAWARTGARAELLLQVNLAHEEQKHGAEPSEVPGLLEFGATLGIEFSGLMLIPPLVSDPEENRHLFQGLREMRDELGAQWGTLRELSMGMTDDFEVAIEEGATLIRVGRAIFGT